MPSASTIMRRRAALGFRCASGSAEEGASAAVADGVDGMALLGVARDVQPAGEAVGWTDPAPPALAVAGRPERRGLGGDPVAEPLELAHRAGHGSGAFGLRLAAVGVVLGDVRAHVAGVLPATEWPAAEVVSAARPAARSITRLTRRSAHPPSGGRWLPRRPSARGRRGPRDRAPARWHDSGPCHGRMAPRAARHDRGRAVRRPPRAGSGTPASSATAGRNAPRRPPPHAGPRRRRPRRRPRPRARRRPARRPAAAPRPPSTRARPMAPPPRRASPPPRAPGPPGGEDPPRGRRVPRPLPGGEDVRMPRVEAEEGPTVLVGDAG